MGTGGYPVPGPGQPPRRRRPPRRPVPPPAPPEPNTEQLPAITDEPPDVPEPAPDEPPAGLAGWRQRRQHPAMEDTEVGVMPAVPPPTDDPDAGPPTGHFTPTFDDDPLEPGDTRSGELDGDFERGDFDQDDFDREFDGDLGAVDDPDAAAYGYPPGDEPVDELDAEDEAIAEEDEEPAGSPAKQWLVLAGQLALGAVSGAAVWLGFNWLWGQLPAAALVAALVVTVALVLVVRKVRRAEDLQTTVLAVLVGLVVTVSPAALLLLSR
ncbi:hypothetical protein SAMN05421810_10727 [Amycolatopsis arida]|uniref:Uncharacterized protein n=2 Tax=Amycolatopsis arida TaxID=587909 RepID=A0A1I5YAG6_9PSEU|nr:hypothetical protein CLV69_10727 [Amycolatopsis arida]SFQ41110.1 hypothetical protein SAMN05421810_10727 [Amycolatopsis arida]